MGKLIEGKELRNLVRLAHFFPGTGVFGKELTEIGSTQIEALIRVMNREIRDKADASKGPNTTTVHFNDEPIDEDFPDVL